MTSVFALEMYAVNVPFQRVFNNRNAFRCSFFKVFVFYLCRVKRMRAAKVQASLRIRAVSPEPPLLVHTSSESRGTVRQKARSLAL